MFDKITTAINLKVLVFGKLGIDSNKVKNKIKVYLCRCSFMLNKDLFFINI